MTTYHEGELEVQERLGVRERADRVGAGVHETIPPPARLFLEAQTLAIVTVVEKGRPVIVPLTGAPGFVRAETESLIRFRNAYASRLPIPVEQGFSVGSIVIDFEGRRRMRANGRGSRDGSDLLLAVTEVYSNCPRFITPRVWESATRKDTPDKNATSLDARQIALIESADTFFIGTAHSSTGADASHRGGEPGFVTVENERTITWPDFEGNAMLNTLGNLAVDPHAALVFIDFSTGDVVQLQGTSQLVIHPERNDRAMRFTIDSVVETPGGLDARWTTVAEPQPRDRSK